MQCVVHVHWMYVLYPMVLCERVQGGGCIPVQWVSVTLCTSGALSAGACSDWYVCVMHTILYMLVGVRVSIDCFCELQLPMKGTTN